MRCRSMRMGPHAALLIAVSLLTASSLAALPGAQSVNCIILGKTTDMGTCLTNAIPLAAIGIMLSLALVAITYMLGEVISIDSLKGWYRNELKETAKSAIIIVIVIATLAILSGIAAILAYQSTQLAPSISPSSIEGNLGFLYSAASGYLLQEQTVASDAFSYITGLSLGIGFLKSFLLGLWTPFPIIPFPPFPVWFHFGFIANLYSSTTIETTTPAGIANYSLIRDAFNFIIMPMYLLFTVQSDLLPVVMQIGLLLFLPIGIILRAIPFIRGIGGTLIAIGIALSLVYPTTLVVLNVPVTGTLAAYAPTGLCAGVGIFGGFECAIFSVVSAGIPPQNTAGFIDGVGSLSSIYPAFNGIQYFLYPLIVQLVLMVLDLFIVYTIAQNIATLLGGSIRLGVGGRLKLA